MNKNTMNLDKATHDRIDELHAQAFSLYHQLMSDALTRQELLDRIWELERQGMEKRTEYQKVITELEEIYEVIFKRED